MAEKRSLRATGAIGLVIWFLTGCASIGSSGTRSDTTHQVTFFYEDSLATTVSVVGSFNAWTPGADPLVRVGTGAWKGTINLPEGVHQYMFLVNGKTYVTDPKAARTLEDGFDRINGLLVVE